MEDNILTIGLSITESSSSFKSIYKEIALWSIQLLAQKENIWNMVIILEYTIHIQ